MVGRVARVPPPANFRKTEPRGSRNETHSRRELRFLLFLGHDGQAEDGKLPDAPDVDTTGVFGAGQVERLTEFAAIDFSINSPGFLHAAALLLEHVGRVEPAFQVPAAEFSLVVFLVAGALTRLLDLDLMVRELRNVGCLRGCRFTCGHDFLRFRKLISVHSILPSLGRPRIVHRERTPERVVRSRLRYLADFVLSHPTLAHESDRPQNAIRVGVRMDHFAWQHSGRLFPKVGVTGDERNLLRNYQLH